MSKTAKTATAKQGVYNLEIIQVPLANLVPYANNARTHSPEQIAKIIASIRERGMYNPIIVDEDNGIMAGHGRYEALGAMDITTAPCIMLKGMSEAQKKALILADNKLALDAGWDTAMLSIELERLKELDFDLTLTGFDEGDLDKLIKDAQDTLAGKGPDLGDGAASEAEVKHAGALMERFGIAPFTVMNAREGWWQNRKKAWISLGIKSEEGRGASPGGSPMPSASYSEDNARGNGAGKAIMFNKSQAGLNAIMKGKQTASLKGLTVGTTMHPYDSQKDTPDGFDSGTSIFDPVLAELCYRWFSPPDAVILDPFAGGSVRGIVAAKLGRSYHGVDLRAEQVNANVEQWLQVQPQLGEMVDGSAYKRPQWYEGDSRNIGTIAQEVKADFLFTCPPYGDLEQYSEDPKDLSNLGYDDFRSAYFEIIAKSCQLLKSDRFAGIVVGDFRDKKGFYRNFVSDTIQAFLDAGLHLYNEAILVTCVGSLPIRAGKQFTASRKLGKTHQNILVFVKDDPVKATKACGDVEFGEILDEAEQPAEGGDAGAEFGEKL